jgi:Tfp pilus assembly PilM family ATPase
MGLEIGRRSLQLVMLDAGRRPDDPPRSVRGVQRELDPALEGDARRQACIRALKECAAELGAGKGECAIAVPRAEAVVKTVVLPQVPAEERARLIRFQAAKEVPFELDQVVLASGVVGASVGAGNADGGPNAPVEVTYAAVRTGVVDGLRSIVREAGLVPGRLEVATQAAARALRLISPEETEALLICIGSIASDIVLIRRGRVAFTRSASVGHARDPKETGTAEAERWLERLVAEVQRSLRSVTGEATDAPRALLVAGAGGREAGAVATLATRLGIPGRALDPIGNGSDPAFLVARGLAEARPVAGIPLLDLAGIADARAAASDKRRAVIAGGLAAGLLVTGLAFFHDKVGDMETYADKLDAQVKAIKPQVDAVKALDHQVQVAKSWEARKGRSLEILLAVSKALPPEDAYLTRFQWSEGQNALLAGRARDGEAVEKFVRRLSRDPLVERATPDFIRRPDKASEAESKGLDFAVTAKVREPAGLEREKAR